MGSMSNCRLAALAVALIVLGGWGTSPESRRDVTALPVRVVNDSVEDRANPRERARALEAFDHACESSDARACVDRAVLLNDAEPPAAFDLCRLVERVRKHERLSILSVSEASHSELRVLRNAVLASRGMAFRSADLQAFFAAFEWYAPRQPNVDPMLSPDDRRNLDLLKEVEGRPEPKARPDASRGTYHEGDWWLVNALVHEDGAPGQKLSEGERSLVGRWGDELASYDVEGSRSFCFFPSGRFIEWGPRLRIGNWRVSGASLKVRYFAELLDNRTSNSDASYAPALVPDKDTERVWDAGHRTRSERTFEGNVYSKVSDDPCPL